ncbi:MAG: spermidine synthase [Gammaproteobacteria bacterium]
MAVIWRKDAGGVHYEVRTAGKTTRLYTNGVLHTQHNPSRLLTGSVWDLLLLPALLLPRDKVRRVLVLGVGGGAVIHQLLRLFPAVQVTAVELNPVHVSVARRFFGLGDPRLHIVCENAVTWLALYDGEPFDLVIDDLFGDRDGQPCRAVDANTDWFDLLAMPLSPGGVLAMNFATQREVRASAWGHGERAVRRRFPGALSLATPGCENRVAVFLPRVVSASELRNAVAAEPLLSGPLLRYGARLLR